MAISTWHLALLWIGLYSLVSLIASRTNRVPDYLTAQGPLTMIHTTRGRDAIDALAERFPRFWPVWGVAGVVLFFGGLVLGTVMLLFSAVQVVNQPGSAQLAKEPQNLLVIPGVNDYLPLDAAPALVGALLIAMVIHELGHAIYCRLGDIDIESTGIVLFALIPAGAFVEPDEDSQEAATRWARLQMVSAGVMNNLGATVVAMAVLVLVVPALVSPAPGAAIGGVLPDSPADSAGIEAGDRIVSVEGTDVTSPAELTQALDATQASSVQMTTAEGESHTVNRRVFVTGAYQSAPVSPGETITHVNEQTVGTTAQFHEAVRTSEDPVVTLTLGSGQTVTHVTGARATTSDASPFAQYASADGTLIITAIDGQRISDAADLSTKLRAVEEGETLSVEGVQSRSNPKTFEMTYTVPSEGESTLAVTGGTGGLSVSEVGVQFFPAEDYLGYITADGPGVLASLVLIVFLPFATVGGLPYNFAGFTPDIVGFYQVAAPLESIAPLVFFGVSLAFWTVWINVNLALFNCLPTFALDGGHYTKYGLESIAARLGSANPKQASKQYARAIALTVLVGIALIMVLPPLFG